jgi:ribosome-associated translation inhibitor RaiA
MAEPATEAIEVVARGAAHAHVDELRARMATLERLTELPLTGMRIVVREVHGGRGAAAWIADARLRAGGRPLAAHATGPSPLAAADAAIERLRRQLRRQIDAQVAQRNEPRTIATALAALDPQRDYRPAAARKPPEERQIVHRRTYADRPLATYEAIADLLDLDHDFLLFRHVRTGEDVVVHRRDDGRIGLIHPRGNRLADEGDDIVVPEPSRYSEPLTLGLSRAEMDVLNHRFLYFIDARDGRGRVLYLRHDGDYGLVEPA